MGQGGYLWVINATSRTLHLDSQQNHQMNSWNFCDILAQTETRFYIEFTQLVSKSKADDSGEANFLIEGSTDRFQVLIRWPYNEGECGLKVDWSGIDLDKYVVFPPAASGDNQGELGWIHNGYLTLLIIEKGVPASVSTTFPGEDSIVSSNPTFPYPIAPVWSKWMEHYSDTLGGLTLTQLTLPGTHDSGTHDPKVDASNPGGAFSAYIRTQNTTLAQQLQDGIRVLDLRIGQVKPGEYVIVHDKYKTNYTLSAALKEVTDFVICSEKEIVILDFHRFVNLNGRSMYDYEQLKQQVACELVDYCLPAGLGRNQPLRKVWALPGKQRIVVAWNTDSPDDYMWPGVNQHWYENAGDLKTLYQVIKKDMLNPPTNEMWAICSFAKSSILATPRKNAELANPTMTQWYFGGSTFCEWANIVSVDFYKDCSNIVQACVVGSLLKAGNLNFT